MRRKRLFWQLFPTFIIMVLISLIAVTWFASASYKSFFINQSKYDLIARTYLIKDKFSQLVIDTESATIDSICKALGNKSSTRITVIAPSGKVLGDTEEDPATMDNHNDRPEVIEAKNEGAGSSIRYSHTLKQDMLYVALPMNLPEGRTASIRTSISLASIGDALWSINTKIIIGGLVIAGIMILVSLYMSRRISVPLEEIRRGAVRFATGDFSQKIPVYDSLEFGMLADSMNQMAEELDTRIKAIIRQRNEQEAVLASMVEGVLAVDMDERVIGHNRAARELLGISAESSEGKTLHEVVRNIDLQRFVARVLATRESAEEEIVLRDAGEKYIQVHGTVLRDAHGHSIGALVVLNDVTRLHRLEAVRRDFVANVSHELKTPVTSIKGFVETLLEGAVNEPESAKRFLEVISRQADRLHAIIEDLLTLSRMEQDYGRTKISLRLEPLNAVLKSAIQVCELKAQESNIRIKISCPEDIRAKINAPLLEQAIINLIDNAIKYSEPESVIGVSGARENGEVVIRVTDRGSGIAREHLPRLFERFYLVDKARSRKLGGTGLGLAIVKHISQAHGGYPKVESIPGKGSTFSIHLPVVE
ncbi:MAG: cell wall metabolism sensor histidine kinase WalK [candidate division Zixibacteria bacterium]|nr:cell wall metabolism sensor histidine kinase WalK [candidate division Zixibacteria bacterium]NIR63095.1 cell wall metabolism sensor histidine kinase WalK [candidate division Zixibacteria bacterium]NIS16571.1 cell wall metabolism sensor histidine kinase WalK [candidate division Zixibacteria bacterium]NIS45092.1 cell wall metabolism sensor histidine kinase WalK [candidate division Zixibacteria bacterium]NIT52647.1 cell wall metabolism sensor histidine kinase WalK [candidate division Zixibacter